MYIINSNNLLHLFLFLLLISAIITVTSILKLQQLKGNNNFDLSYFGTTKPSYSNEVNTYIILLWTFSSLLFISIFFILHINNNNVTITFSIVLILLITSFIILIISLLKLKELNGNNGFNLGITNPTHSKDIYTFITLLWISIIVSLITYCYLIYYNSDESYESDTKFNMKQIIKSNNKSNTKKLTKKNSKSKY